MICLQGGNYSNEGHVEVYCNGQWEQYVMMDLILMNHLFSVNNWDIQTIQVIIIFLCMFSTIDYTGSILYLL